MGWFKKLFPEKPVREVLEENLSFQDAILHLFEEETRKHAKESATYKKIPFQYSVIRSDGIESFLETGKCKLELKCFVTHQHDLVLTDTNHDLFRTAPEDFMMIWNLVKETT